jgi:hypothetical protein
MRVAILVAIIHVRRTVVVKVLSRSFDAIVKALALNLAKLRGRGVPSVIVILSYASRRSGRRLGRDQPGRSQRKSKY